MSLPIPAPTPTPLDRRRALIAARAAKLRAERRTEALRARGQRSADTRRLKGNALASKFGPGGHEATGWLYSRLRIVADFSDQRMREAGHAAACRACLDRLPCRTGARLRMEVRMVEIGGYGR